MSSHCQNVPFPRRKFWPPKIRLMFAKKMQVENVLHINPQTDRLTVLMLRPPHKGVAFSRCSFGEFDQINKWWRTDDVQRTVRGHGCAMRTFYSKTEKALVFFISFMKYCADCLSEAKITLLFKSMSKWTVRSWHFGVAMKNLCNLWHWSQEH